MPFTAKVAKGKTVNGDVVANGGIQRVYGKAISSVITGASQIIYPGGLAS